MSQVNTYNCQNNDTEELSINFKKMLYALKNRKELILKVFCSVLVFFILLTFVTAKKYSVSTDIYINKTFSSNMAEFNPYLLEDTGGGVSMLSSLSPLSNEIELIKSPLVIDKVIRDNNLKYKKKWGFIPNKKEGEYISTAAFLGKKDKNIFIENKKGTKIIQIEYKSKNPELAYNVVTSIITHYIELNKEINSEKSKSDIKILESEYNRLKDELSGKINSIKGLPTTSLSGTGNITAMSAFSKPAAKAIATIQNQYMQGSKSQMEITEISSKVSAISSKLEWAKIVEEMSDSSKVLILKEPIMPRDFENVSPKLLINIIIGIIFGIIASLITVLHKENTDKKLTYTMLGDKLIYNMQEELNHLKSILVSNNEKNIGLIIFENISPQLQELIRTYNNIQIIKADISNEFKSKINDSDKVILCEKINTTDSETYKLIKNIILNEKKEILAEVLL